MFQVWATFQRYIPLDKEEYEDQYYTEESGYCDPMNYTTEDGEDPIFVSMLTKEALDEIVEKFPGGVYNGKRYGYSIESDAVQNFEDGSFTIYFLHVKER